MACDSQTTAGTFKRTDTSKITEYAFGDVPILIAESGDATLAQHALEKFDSLIANSSFDDYRKPADLLQDAVRFSKEELIRLNGWQGHLEIADQYFNENPFSLMLAYFHETTPFLYVVNSMPGFATRQRNFSVIGCGANVGGFILSRALHAKMGHPEALMAAIYTVEEVKKADAFCGGPTNAAVLSARRVMFSESDMQRLVRCAVEAIQSSEIALEQRWKALFNDSLRASSERYNEQKKRWSEFGDPPPDLSGPTF